MWWICSFSHWWTLNGQTIAGRWWVIWEHITYMSMSPACQCRMHVNVVCMSNDLSSCMHVDYDPQYILVSWSDIRNDQSLCGINMVSLGSVKVQTTDPRPNWVRLIWCAVNHCHVVHGSLRDLGLELFGLLIVNHSRVQQRIITGIITLINKERWVEESVGQSM